MFMTINQETKLFKFGCSEYLLNKESRNLPENLSVYAYINNGSMIRHVPLQVLGTDDGLILTTELGLEPLGYIIYHEIPANF